MLAGRSTIKNYRHTLLTDGAISLRPPVIGDTENIHQAILESLDEISPWLPFVHKGYSYQETRDFLKRCPDNWKQDTEYIFIILDAGDGSCIGMCGLNRIDHENLRANLGYWIKTSRTGSGIATAVTRLLARWGFQEPKFNRIEIVMATGNQRSQRVAEKAGARREGILRNRIKVREDLHDAVMYSLVPGDLK